MGAAQGRVGRARGGRTLAVVSPLVGGFYFGSIVAGVTRAAARAGMRVVAVQTFPTRLARERHPREPLAGDTGALSAADAVVVVVDALTEDRLAALVAEGRPVVAIGTDTQLAIPVLRPDNRAAARLAVGHLLAHGHTEIGFAGDLAQGDIRERHEGYLQALAEHGIPYREDWFHPGANTVPGGADAAEVFLAAGSPTTATVAATDLAAIGLVRGLQRSGHDVPRDLAVVGFDHIEGGARLDPRLTTVDLRHDRVGELAVAHVATLLDGGAVGPVPRVAPALVVRESCGCTEVTTVVAGPDPATSSAPPAGRSAAPPPAPSAPTTPGREHLARVARTAFAGVGFVASGRLDDGAARAVWTERVLSVLDTAAVRGGHPTSASLRRLRDLTALLDPHPEALEQCLTAVRRVERELAGEATTPARAAVLARTVTDVLLTLTQGCLRPHLAREAAMERTIADQYEVDMDVTTARADTPRTLAWLPGTGRARACLALWTGRRTATGEREVEVVGALARSGALARTVGRRMAAGDFPPAALLRGEPIDGSTLVFVVPVTSPRKDWGLLAVTGRLDPRMTYSRERHQHWGALLAVALDREEELAELRERADAAEREASRSRAETSLLRRHQEQSALWLDALQHGTWDWDIANGTAHWSPQWAALLGVRVDELTTAPAEWLDRVHPDDRSALATLVAAHLGGAEGPMRLEHRVRHASGEYRWMSCQAVTVPDETGAPGRLVGVLVDVTERRARETALAQHVLRDPETGLPNRAAFLDRLEDLLERTRHHGGDAAVAVLRVREPEAELGDPPSSDVVRVVAGALSRVAHHGDVVGRVSSTSLACAYLDRDGRTGTEVVNQVLDALDPEHRRRLAVGLVTDVRRHADATDVVRAADTVADRDLLGTARP